MQSVKEIITARKGGGRGGNFPSGVEEPRFTLNTRNGTVRDYLNELVRVSRARMWMVEFSDLSTMTDEGLFQVASVASGASLSLWRLLSMRPVSGPVIVNRPVVLSRVQPTYTEEARRVRNEGSVVMLVEVDLTGRPKVKRVLRPLGNGLDEKAIEAVHKWRFRPAYEGGKPVTMYTTLEVEFHLR